MRVSELLRQVHREVWQLESLRLQKSMLMRDAAEPKAIQYDKSKISGGKQKDLSDTLISIEQRVARMDKLIILRLEKIMRYREELYRLMEKLPDSPGKIAVQEHYLYRVPWSVVAKHINFNIDYTKQMAYKFILKLEKIDRG